MRATIASGKRASMPRGGPSRLEFALRQVRAGPRATTHMPPVARAHVFRAACFEQARQWVTTLAHCLECCQNDCGADGSEETEI